VNLLDVKDEPLVHIERDAMPLKTARFNEAAHVEVDQSKCTGCGACAKVCRGYPLSMDGKQVRVDQARGWGCIGCGA
jgi:TPP-dependent indolepyruvate ferredoxin oxidoreductase alpha subunit